MGIINTADVKILREMLERHNVKMKKSLGQNFLTDGAAPRKIAEISRESAHDGKTRGVLEIGAGAGALTAALAGLYDKVVSVECDNSLAPLLSETFLDAGGNVRFIFADFLEVELEKIMDQEFGGCGIDVCANLPYYITTPVIMKLLEHGRGIDSMTLMLQREAAVRIFAGNGGLSVLTGYFGRSARRMKLAPSSFYPPPEVNSVVVKITAHSERLLLPAEERIFFKLVGAAFTHRRKTLINSLCGALPELPRGHIADAVKKTVGADAEKIRAEQMNLEQFLTLSGRIGI